MPVLTTLPLLLRKRKQSNYANSHCVEYLFCSRLYLHRGKKTTIYTYKFNQGTKAVQCMCCHGNKADKVKLTFRKSTVVYFAFSRPLLTCHLPD